MTMQQTIQIEKTEEEKKQLLAFFEKLDKDLLKGVAEAISMMVRAFEGRPVEPEDVISRLTNVKNILERSRFPTYPLLAKQVYLRLIAEFHPECKAFAKWADREAEALISYKGLSREEYVEMTKAATQGEPTQVFYGERKGMVSQEPRRHFWQRKPKAPKEETEFENQ